MLPPIPPADTTIPSRRQGITPGATKVGLSEEAIARAPTALVFRECCQVAYAMPLSSGLGLRKRVMTGLESLLNNAACGPTSVQTKAG